MTIIQLPTILEASQLEAVQKLVDTYIPDEHEKGIQIFQGSRENPLGNIDCGELSQHLRGDYFVTLHAPFALEFSPEYFMANPAPKLPLRKTFDAARKIDANSVTIHLSLAFTAPMINSPAVWSYRSLDAAKEAFLDAAYQNVMDLARECDIKLGVENMPILYRGDYYNTLQKIRYEPALTTIEMILDFMRETNIGLCLDICHYNLNRDIINDAGTSATPESLSELGIYGLLPGMMGQQPPVEDAVKKILSRGQIVDLQIADHGRKWIQNEQLMQEGLPIGAGRGGDGVLATAKYVARNSPKTPISLDVEEHDYIRRPNQLASLEKLLATLDH